MPGELKTLRRVIWGREERSQRMSIEKVTCEVTNCECGETDCEFKQVDLVLTDSCGESSSVRGQAATTYSAAIRDGLAFNLGECSAVERDEWITRLSMRLAIQSPCIGTKVTVTRSELEPGKQVQEPEIPSQSVVELFDKKGMIEMLRDLTTFTQAIALHLSRRPDMSGFQNRVLDGAITSLAKVMKAILELYRSETVKL
jgi:hypothetical protein